MTDNKKYNVLDLFCDCGGLSLGFKMAGFNVLLGVDNWGDALVTFKANHKESKTLCADLATLDPEDVQRQIGLQPVDVIIGGPPCQGFSIAGKRIVEDKRNKLYKSFVKMVSYFKPAAFVLENVPNILTMGGGAVRNSIMSDFEQLGYRVVYQVLTASNYGVPQNRKRAIFAGLLNGKDFEYPQSSVETAITTLEALSDLPENSIVNGGAYPEEAKSEYQKLMRKNSQGVYNHQITIHTKRTQEIISLVSDGGNYKDLPLNLQQTRKVHIAWTRL